MIDLDLLVSARAAAIAAVAAVPLITRPLMTGALMAPAGCSPADSASLVALIDHHAQRNVPR